MNKSKFPKGSHVIYKQPKRERSEARYLGDAPSPGLHHAVVRFVNHHSYYGVGVVDETGKNPRESIVAMWGTYRIRAFDPKVS